MAKPSAVNGHIGRMMQRIKYTAYLAGSTLKDRVVNMKAWLLAMVETPHVDPFLLFPYGIREHSA